MEQKTDRNIYTSDQADTYCTDMGQLIETEVSLIRLLLENAPNIKTANILDAGCGGGDHLQNLRKLTTGAVYGIDISQDMLEKAKKALATQDNAVNFGKVDLVEDDICSTIQVPQGFFNVALCTFVLCHARNVSELQKIIGNVARSLTSGGKFYVLTCSPSITLQDFQRFGSKYSLNIVMSDKTKDNLSNGDEYIVNVLDPVTKETTFTVPGYFYDKETFERIFKEEGFKVERIEAMDKVTGLPAELTAKDRFDAALIEATKL